jgi:NADH dehydrogenase
VVLLGATGFLGRAVAHSILDAGHRLRVLVRDQQHAAGLRVRGAEVLVGDALQPNALRAACLGADHAVSLVAVRRNRPQSYLEINVDGPRRLAEAAMYQRVKSIVFVSAIGARLDPKYQYLTSRWMGEEELRKQKIPSTILRFSFILGDDGGVVLDFERAAKFGPVIVIPGSGQGRFQPIVREDAARCVADAVARPDLLHKTIDLGGPEVLTYEQLFSLFCQARAIGKKRLHIPIPLLIPAAAIMDILSSNPPVTPDELRTIQLDNLAEGLDSVAVNFGFRPQAPTSWIPNHWAPHPTG